ncbi:sugar nucleotide-binding protein [Luteimonas yindakuii]|uniref:dTDP-4-dehydrorhamnose reductase n=1 Tax=Luteimonas yindakuii TaxID=2565782 RepID=A0A4Z1R9Q9_9GAMM|nr:family 1 glycosylhydrolase [Luteimonas yindakuii]TKS52893.1 sugar nucleotide-binding protein [Luteimonas yindakuii]
MSVAPDTGMCGIALWGGVECTINRVGDAWFSQLQRNGHMVRADDLDTFASLGMRALRQPVLWEQVAPDGLASADWSWPDACLARLRELDIEPIVGLLHHGGGPAATSLVDADFGEKFAVYAAAVAQRYPWVRDWTPVNEPLTTARFSGLYGCWAPHGRDPAIFWQVLRNECRATVLAMRAIRRVRPDARLVQTDDLGRTWSVPSLAHQAEFNNHLRWLAWDLLCGRVDATHPLHGWLRGCCGAVAEDIAWFTDNPCPPDLIGANYYVTSERYLDDAIERYPAALHGGNGRERYVDVEAVRMLDVPPPGIETLLQEAWDRYRIPIAITEVHLGGHREEQLRWLDEIWRGACRAREAGIDLRAITLWALLGSHDWDCLLTECRDYYESGVFDVRGGSLRPTALARMAAQLGHGEPPSHPVLASPGWWRRPSRMLHAATHAQEPTAGQARPILITGATGTLGGAFARICQARGLSHRVLTRAELDIADGDAVRRALDGCEPWAIINAAGYVRVDEAERDHARCYRENSDGPATLARACARDGVALVTFSSDLVFDGRQGAPYVEDDAIAPLNVYGRSKARGEALVLDRHPDALVVRTSAFFGPWDEYNFVCLLLRALRAGLPFEAASDVTVSPTYVPDLVHACLDLLVDGEAGIWHLTNGEPVTWLELAHRAAQAAATDPVGVCGRMAAEFGWLAPRPAYSALGSQRSLVMPALDDALARCVRDSVT